MRSKHGFTLLEISIVLLISATLLSGGLLTLVNYMSRAKNQDTHNQLEQLEAALYQYAVAYNRLPCPADLTQAITANAFGMEASIMGDCYDTGAIRANFKDGTNTNAVAGMIPTKTLGLADDMAFDSWDSRIVYAVDKRYTEENAFSTYSISTAGVFSMLDVNSTAFANPIYVLLSPSRNRHGAYPRVGGTIRQTGALDASTPLTNVRELENCDCNATTGQSGTYDNVYTQSGYTQATADAANMFDDAVKFKTRSQLVFQQAEEFLPDDITGLVLWLDASDNATVTLTYSTDGLGAATAGGNIGTNTVTTSADVSASIAVGARIRLGAAGPVTTPDTLGADTYTLTAVAGTTLTVTPALTATYAAQALRRGLVSQLTDKSGTNNHATQATEANMPLWVSNAVNGRAILKFDGGNDFFDIPTTSFPTTTQARSTFAALAPLSTTSRGFILSYGSNADLQKWDFEINGWAGAPTNGRFIIHTWNDGKMTTNVVLAIGTAVLLGAVLPAADIDTSNLYVDGVLQALSYPTGVTLPGSNVNTASGNGKIGTRSATANYLSANLFEVIYYAGALADADRQQVEDYQSDKWQ